MLRPLVSFVCSPRSLWYRERALLPHFYIPIASATQVTCRRRRRRDRDAALNPADLIARTTAESSVAKTYRRAIGVYTLSACVHCDLFLYSFSLFSTFPSSSFLSVSTFFIFISISWFPFFLLFSYYSYHVFLLPAAMFRDPAQWCGALESEINDLRLPLRQALFLRLVIFLFYPLYFSQHYIFLVGNAVPPSLQLSFHTPWSLTSSSSIGVFLKYCTWDFCFLVVVVVRESYIHSCPSPGFRRTGRHTHMKCVWRWPKKK